MGIAPPWLLPGSPFVGTRPLRFDDGDEVVVFNPVTCHTHLLNRPAADLLVALEAEPALAAETSPGNPDADALTADERKHLHTLLQELRFLGLFIG